MLTVAGDVSVAAFVARCREGSAHALGGGRRVGHGSLQDGDELLAAEAANDVIGAYSCAHDAREQLQHGIASRLAEAVVDRFEMVEVEGKDADRRLALFARIAPAHRRPRRIPAGSAMW